MRLDVIDECDIVEFVGCVDGEEGRPCSAYFHGRDIAVVNLDKYVRVALYKC